MRLTRAAQRAQQDVDEPTTDVTEAVERSPLHEISANASPEQIAPVEEAVAEADPAQEELEDEQPAEEIPTSDVVVENIITAPLDGERREPSIRDNH
jgi:hypothetical protein